MTIGEKIRKLRRGLEWSQERLAELSDTYQEKISRVEKGGSIDFEDVLKIAKALGASLSDLVGEENVQSGIKLNKEEIEVIKYLREIGIDSVDKCKEVLSPESIAKEVALLISQRLGKYKIKRKL